MAGTLEGQRREIRKCNGGGKRMMLGRGILGREGRGRRWQGLGKGGTRMWGWGRRKRRREWKLLKRICELGEFSE